MIVIFFCGYSSIPLDLFKNYLFLPSVMYNDLGKGIKELREKLKSGFLFNIRVFNR